MSMRRIKFFSFIVLSIFLCTFPVAAILPDDPDPVSGMMTALVILAVLLTLACIFAAVWGAVVAGIFLLLERLPMPRVRAAIPPVVLVLIAGAALVGTWGRHSMPFLVSILILAMAVLVPWPVVASRFGAGRRPWVLVLVAAFTTLILANPLHFFPYAGGPGGVPYFFPGSQGMFLEIGELVCIACFVWVLMLLLSYLEEGERVFLAAPAVALAWVVPSGALSSVFPEGAFIAGGVAAVLLLAAAPLVGRRRRVWALLLVVSAALAVAGGHPLLLTPGGEWAILSIALFIVLMIGFGTAAGVLLVPPGEFPWCMGAVFAAPLLVTLVYRLVGGTRTEIWEQVGASVPSLLLLGAVSVVAAAAVGGVVRWARSRYRGTAP
ncbi:hypothetical protein J2129_001662 [Methanofollis sp. W23]|uniref:hypothetical protein n=1 Tax=Methanofollis sp. W23 TaxID=2817849 RepID=UPI001AE7B86C|nr:hypothetical protein [Methanofollis sp. W23]MBP2146208.1 hypothetical protein [Methanofollis sp. W23]